MDLPRAWSEGWSGLRKPERALRKTVAGVEVGLVKGMACSHLEYQALSCKHGELGGVFRRNFGGLDFKDNVLGGSVYSGSQKGEQRRLHRNPDMGTGFQCENGSDEETPVPGRSQ